MKVKILGKQFREGTSKNGQPYKMVRLFVSYPADDVTGVFVRDVAIFNSNMNYDEIKINADVDLVLDFNGHVTKIVPV